MTPESTDSLDDLLGAPPTSEEREAVELSKVGGVPPLTPEQSRIAELEAQLAALTAAQGKTDEQKQREHTSALAANLMLDSAAEVFDTSNGENDIVIHVLQDGVTFAGRVWFLGQTIRFSRGGAAFSETLDRAGNSWLDDLSDESQIRRYGKVLFGMGPWQGRVFDDELAKEDLKRGDSAPVIPLN